MASDPSLPWRKAVMLWLAILVLAFVNGALRETALVPAFGRIPGQVASAAILSACILLVAWAGAAWCGRRPKRQWLVLGILWLSLTLVFEFTFGRVVQGESWHEMLQAYTFKDGNLWPLVLVVTLVAPWLGARIRGLA